MCFQKTVKPKRNRWTCDLMSVGLEFPIWQTGLYLNKAGLKQLCLTDDRREKLWGWTSRRHKGRSSHVFTEMQTLSRGKNKIRNTKGSIKYMISISVDGLYLTDLLKRRHKVVVTNQRQSVEHVDSLKHTQGRCHSFSDILYRNHFAFYLKQESGTLIN